MNTNNIKTSMIIILTIMVTVLTLIMNYQSNLVNQIQQQITEHSTDYDWQNGSDSGLLIDPVGTTNILYILDNK